MGDELPYASTVVIEDWQEDERGVHVNACVRLAVAKSPIPFYSVRVGSI